MSPNTPSGRTVAAAAWLINASETRNTTLTSQRTKISALCILTCARAEPTSTNAVAISPRRSCQTRPNCVSIKTVPDTDTEKVLLSGNPPMLATSSQNQRRAERSATIRVQTVRRSKLRSISRKWSLSDGPVKPSITRSKVKVPVIRIDALMCSARARMSCGTNMASPTTEWLTTNVEHEVSVCHMCIHRNYAPHDLVSARAQLRQRNVHERVVGAIQMQIAFIHFFA